ncbi:MAG TPA: ABC transporter substrate-binding protein [Amycolatopsis sp.]|nr:ABC transporter substrate-binding protein [Amycolatopsis sp.]
MADLGQAAIRIGVVLENADRSPDQPVFRGLQLCAEAANSTTGVAGRDVELVFRRAEGAHAGLPENCVTAWAELAADPGVIGIIGPGISDNCLPLIAPVEAGRVPTLQWSGADEARGEWYFQFPWGSLTDESDYLVELLRTLGHRRVGVLHAGVVGARYLAAFSEGATTAGIDIVATRSAPVSRDDVVAEVTDIHDAAPDAVVFLGMGEPTLAFGRAINELRWDVPRFANIAMLGAALDKESLSVNEGIIWTDQYDGDKPLVRDIRAGYEKRYRRRAPQAGQLGVGYDMMTLLVAGLRRAPHLTRAGLKAGLEKVRNLPCATGGPRAIMGYGPWDRSAIKGADMFIYRTIRDGAPIAYPVQRR